MRESRHQDRTVLAPSGERHLLCIGSLGTQNGIRLLPAALRHGSTVSEPLQLLKDRRTGKAGSPSHEQHSE